MIRAMLVTPFHPQPTGLADYAKRIFSLTKEKVEWTLAYPSSASPVKGYHCIPISELKSGDFNVPVIYQIGNSPHCREVIEVLLENGGTSLFHETNMHHVLRDQANRSSDWTSYNDHALHDYGDGSEAFLERMGKKAKSFSEYDERLRNNPLAGKLISSSRIIAVLSDTAKQKIEKLAPDKQVIKMGFLPDFLERAERPAAKSDNLIIGVAGSFHYGRSWEDIVNAVAMLRRTVNCELLVVGGGWPETDHDWIKVTGRLPDKEFRQELEKIDIAIDLRHDTCGETSGSMMDLLRSGIPAVVTAEGTFRDIPAAAVLRIPPESGSHGAFAALKFLLENDSIRSSISQAAEKYFAHISNKEKCLNEWIDLIERSRW
ncbi:MAG: hypothetical protein KAH31_01345 [Candidatus Sabulitectum sp.]|nr:hypothetical protein [Candidatus Sabulitectum sp.]